MTDPLDTAVNDALCEILEVSACELADAVPPTLPPDGAIGVTLQFSGEYAGHLKLWVAHDEAVALTSTLLAVDAPDPTTIADAVVELANMVAGHALSRLYGEAIINLDRGALATGDRAIRAPLAIQVMGERGPLAATLEVFA